MRRVLFEPGQALRLFVQPNLRIVLVTKRGARSSPFCLLQLKVYTCYTKTMSKSQKVLLFFQYGIAYVTGENVKFTQEHPYQLVEPHEVESLISTGRFRRAAPDEVKEHYQIGE